ncbi:hypothetical protein BD414DRAFT_484894 [Trametes punicea]|nr:hypothetical protein BD414DRAFT_484894 [Trametes punicea]
MYATHADSPDAPQVSHITNLLYTTIPSYTTSDHVRPFLVFTFTFTFTVTFTFTLLISSPCLSPN